MFLCGPAAAQPQAKAQVGSQQGSKTAKVEKTLSLKCFEENENH